MKILTKITKKEIMSFQEPQYNMSVSLTDLSQLLESTKTKSKIFKCKRALYA